MVKMNASTYLGNCSEEHFYDTSEFRYTITSVFYSFLFIVGLPVNITSLWFLVRGKKGVTEIKIYMISLTVADLLFVIFLPFWIDYSYRKGNWIFSSFMCSLWGSLFYINTYNTILLLALISFTRYLAVSQPVKVAQSTQNVRGFTLTALIWTTTIGAALPTLINHKQHVIGANGSNLRCFEYYQEEGTKIEVLIIHLVMLLGFIIGFGVVIANSALILRRLSIDKKTLGPSHRLKTRAFRMVLAVLVIYIVCFLPYHVVHLFWTILVLNFWKPVDCTTRKSVNDVHQVFLCLMCMNCILDPILYCFLTTSFRQYLNELIQSCSRKGTTRRSPTLQEIQLS
ncbi:platelet-activating factor receptor-like [Scyliorhinus canicula]|uniref:platelet-activating factor receptor-like n=1 Tax=Scyliorhinus canicula TaxID=7830 RepID=UPI0018F7AB48|nr:platelet-activating factor receptor-like [Scyliorhinus canicula]